MTNLFRQLPEMNWFAATHFRDKALSTQVFIIKQMTRTGSQQETLAMTSLSEFLTNFLHANNSWFTVIISTR